MIVRESLQGTHMEINLQSQLEFRLKRFDELIRIEFDLVGYRMTWLMTSQSFFFAAFALCAVTSGTPYPIIVFALLITLPLIGALSAHLVSRAIDAAHKEIVKLKDGRDRLEGDAGLHGYEKLGVSSDSHIHEYGNSPSRRLPLLLVISWCIALTLVLVEFLIKYVRTIH